MGSQNGINNRITDNDFTVTNLDPGGNAFISVSNLSTAGSSNAVLETQVASGTAGDPFVSYDVIGGSNWAAGIDNSDSDSFVISQAILPGTKNTVHIDTNGQVTKPLQATFMVFLNTTVNNVTGDGTPYTVIYDTKSFDVGTNFSLVTGLFTAPIAGKYLFNAAGALTSMNGTPVNAIFQFIVNGATAFRFAEFTPVTGIPYTASAAGSIILNLAATNTVGVIAASNFGTKVANARGVEGGVVVNNFFSGMLLA